MDIIKKCARIKQIQKISLALASFSAFLSITNNLFSENVRNELFEIINAVFGIKTIPEVQELTLQTIFLIMIIVIGLILYVIFTPISKKLGCNEI